MAPAGVPLLIGTPDLHARCRALCEHVVPGMFVFARQQIIRKIICTDPIQTADDKVRKINTAIQTFLFNQINQRLISARRLQTKEQRQSVGMQRCVIGTRHIKEQTRFFIIYGGNQRIAHRRILYLEFRCAFSVPDDPVQRRQCFQKTVKQHIHRCADAVKGGIVIVTVAQILRPVYEQNIDLLRNLRHMTDARKQSVFIEKSGIICPDPFRCRKMLCKECRICRVIVIFQKKQRNQRGIIRIDVDIIGRQVSHHRRTNARGIGTVLDEFPINPSICCQNQMG